MFATLVGCADKSQVRSHLTSNDAQSAIVNGFKIDKTHPLAKVTVGVYDIVSGMICTGTLVADDVVLTAAHCIGSDPEKMRIIFDTEFTPNSPTRKIKQIEISRYWEANRQAPVDTGDLALIQMSEPAPADYFTAKFLLSAKTLRRFSTSTVLGYGVTGTTEHSGAGRLRLAEIPFADFEYGSTEVKMDQTKGFGVCHGDSGGPAFISINNQFFLWGVISRGVEDPQDQCDRYAVFTNIIVYRSWIIETLQNFRRSLVNRTLGNRPWQK